MSKDKNLPFAYEDMIYDLTHNINKSNANLTEGQTIKTLSLLKSTHMPASYIRNKNLRKQYKEMLLSGSGDGPIPKKSTQ